MNNNVRVHEPDSKKYPPSHAVHGVSAVAVHVPKVAQWSRVVAHSAWNK